MSGGLILALDGSAPRFSLALAGAKGELMAERVLEQATSSRTLFHSLDEMLEAQVVTRKDLGTILATRGPGSFTGVRVALAAAWGLHQALALPAAAVDSLGALAECIPEEVDEGLMAIDALRGEFYAQRFGGIERAAVDSARLLTRSEVEALSVSIVVGFGVRNLEQRTIEPESLAAAAIRRFLRQGRQVDPTLLTQPLYLREAAVSRPRNGTAA